ncbi:Glu/Leu/Phe/Val dehydrogenase dimerization domain-containing protein [Kitasatospora aureofaciens]|uniref:Glu/Leu/Phe/Val dehydrogenase dimerization domain-containing protein n=1 Tax=Kitasatospora aureofaciens TaxID=1894 RepID=UPI001C454AC2|nr:valine dehydrogenase [Kitasatospora aureofaciens]
MTDVQTPATHPAPGVLSRIFRTEQDGAPGDGHEQVVLCHDRSSGLKAIIAIHSTALGPALGGTRFFPYASEEAALEDALNLSRGMSYKNALAGLDLGGGKAVIIGDPNKDKNEAMLRAYGRFVESLRGRYITACDVGTYVQDMDVIARETEFVTGRSPEHGGAGDSSILTAFGVFQGMRATAQARWGQPTLRGKRVGVAGVGKVGHYLVGHLVADGATVVITDVSEAAVNRVRAAHPEVEVVADTAALLQAKLDVYAPCALGGALTDQSVAALTEFGTSIVCGAANNQLAHPGVEKDLADRGILYAPDYLVNSGGVIQVADEIEGFNFERAKNKATKIFDTTLEIFTRAAADGVPPAVAADRLAEKRMREISALRTVLLPGARRG